MKTIRCGIIGAGFIGPHHVEAIRRLGFVEIVALCGSNSAAAKAKAAQLFIPKAYGDYRELLNDPDIDVVDIAVPTHLHFPMAMAAVRAKRHVIVDKPLALNVAEARQLVQAARRARVVNAVTFNYRGNPLVQQMRVMVRRGDLGRLHLIHGRYLQEWLLYDTDFSWRLEADQAGAAAMIGDAGSHWFDLAEFVTGARITHVLGELDTTIRTRRRPLTARVAFQAAGKEKTAPFQVTVPDFGSVLARFDNGAHGVFVNSSLCAGHKNDLRLELHGLKVSLEWQQERPNELNIGRRDAPNEILLKDPSLLDESIRHYAALPGGHNEAWPDAFRNLMRNIFTFIGEGRDPLKADGVAFPTFADGLRTACIVEAIMQSSGRWTKVRKI
jgi:predicted dehydrogenase